MPILYKNKKDCCGCAACMNICPEGAIHMVTDKNGFLFPEINNEKCVNCKFCTKVCAFQNNPKKLGKPLETYIAINKDKKILSNSASGGVFGALANFIFRKKGVVFGCAYNNDMEPVHINADNVNDMKRIQGSKYVQSSMGYSYKTAEKFLHKGRWVLFTGTPCQIDGFKSFLGREYNKLICVDIICHGVPNAEFFKDYVNYMEQQLGEKIVGFVFRDKLRGWGKFLLKIVIEKKGKRYNKFMYSDSSYYYKYFLKRHIYRKSCYVCKYACGNRLGDFTMGDFWGIKKYHPEIEVEEGVSVLLVNTSTAKELLDDLSECLKLKESTFDKAKEHNGQLQNPPEFSKKREKIFKIWRKEGCEVLDKKYLDEKKRKDYLNKMKAIIPRSIKEKIKRFILEKIKKYFYTTQYE